MQVYPSYRFRDKDPIIDKLRTIVADEGKKYTEVSVETGVSTSTLNAWFNGATRRPQFCTVMAVARGLGYDFALTRASSNGHAKKTITVKARRLSAG